MRLGSLLVEAKLTEVRLSVARSHYIVEDYCNFDEVFDCDLLPRVEINTSRPPTPCQRVS